MKQTTLTGGVQSPRRAGPNSSPPKPAAKRKRQHHSEADSQSDDSDDVGAIKLEPKKRDDDDDDLPIIATKRRRRTLVVGSDAEDSDEEIITVKKTKQKGQEDKGKGKGKDKAPSQTRKKGKEPLKQKKNSKSVPDEEDSPQPRRRKLIKGTRPAPRSDTEASDEVEPERIIESRLRSRDRKTEFQKNLERLKRKKQGKPMSSEDEEGEEEDEEQSSPFKGAAAPDDERDSLFDGSESDGSESFIVEDDGTGMATLPVEFSMDTHQDLAHHFKTIFQFFVHVAVHPPVERHEYMERQMKNEEYFSVPLTVARRKILGLRDSLVASSVWRPEFKKPLETYPELDLIQLEFAMPGCDACHLGARMSTLTGRLLGEPYDRLGFEDQDAFGNRTNSKDKLKNEFQLGKFCARRTRVYHDLSHWEYMLFRTIHEEVEDLHVDQQEEGAGRFVRVAYAGGMKPPEDLQDADGICDWLDQRKIIEMEWEKLKGYMERARGLELAAKKGDDVD
ncbi:hypothetical protein BDP27DRAFT_1415624 [Rhodocollybia butyracea]|uniref:DUF4211 domain-containing protein n=1 Tax=Rhodocollybia butyracea TaxID=206335 RepID=A0A9P5PZ50_9AGAR|nr:hypothetical protein BDP27DRAFT_1415624 [Rhodocollybia butyracea]